ncbi:hypothetical protein XELAEV_18004647mg [Xenopus laevis]|uniref:Uncharacterized protein n=1 Tax=Xenopus laevis TaxID=8355 RepID=A0A974GYN4_XENLA|nr:hypothetical protein XELAEV_18004647mg [Xenopus laevis]
MAAEGRQNVDKWVSGWRGSWRSPPISASDWRLYRAEEPEEVVVISRSLTSAIIVSDMSRALLTSCVKF